MGISIINSILPFIKNKDLTAFIDAGICGSYENACSLQEQKLKFVVCCSPTRSSVIWKKSKEKLVYLSQYCFYSSLFNNINAVSWKCSPTKTFHFFTNIPEALETVHVKRWIKKEKVKIYSPKVIPWYNLNHNKVDVAKKKWIPIGNKQKNNRFWKVQLFAYIKCIIQNT